MAHTGKQTDRGWVVLKRDLSRRIRAARKELERLEPLRLKCVAMNPQPVQQLQDLDAQIKKQRERISLWQELRDNATMLEQPARKARRFTAKKELVVSIESAVEPQPSELQISLAELADSPIFGIADAAVPVFEQLAG